MEPQLSEFLLASRKEGNERIRDRIVFPRLSYPEEWQRWAETDGPVWVEERLTGAGSRESTVLGRIERRRFYRSDSLDSSEMKDWWKKKTRRYRAGNLVQREWISTGSQRFYRVSWVDGRKQFVADFAAQFRGKPPLETLLRLRQATLEAKKPAALQKEKRYFVSETADGSPQIVSWTQLYEAGHISHQNGRDVDLSYVMTDDRLLFSRSVAQIDAPKSRRWLEILYEAGRRAGVEIDALLVDGRVRRHLMRGMPEQQALHPVWGLLKVVKGHDSHVHVRLAPGFFAGERNAGVLPE